MLYDGPFAEGFVNMLLFAGGHLEDILALLWLQGMPVAFGIRSVPFPVPAAIGGLVLALFLTLRYPLKFNAKIAAWLAISMGILLFGGYFTYTVLVRSQESLAWIAHTNKVLSVSDGVNADLVLAEAHSRNYLWTVNPADLEAWREDVAKARRGIAELRSLTADNPHQQLALDRIGPLFATTVETIQGRLVWEQSHGRQAALSSFAELEGWNTARPLTLLLLNFSDAERVLLRERMQIAAMNLDQSRLLVVLGLGMMLFFLGITARFVALEVHARKLAANLRESDEKLRLLISGVKDYAILMLDPEGRVASWNAGAEKIKGYRADEIIGQHFSRFYPATDQDKPAHELEVAVATGRFEEEGWRVRKDGSRFWASVVITALHDEQGRLRGFGKVTRDITERKKASDERLQLNAELESRSQELMEANQELEAFSYTAAHDLRAPLRHMDSFVSCLHEDYYEKLDEEGRRCVDKIAKAAKSMGRLLDDLLAFSQLGRTEVKSGPVSLSRLVEQIQQELEPEWKGRALTWEIAALPEVEGDAALMHQVVFNLMANAVKYTGKCDQAHIQIGAMEDVPQHVTMFVRDNGAGFDMRYVDKLFGVFQRLHKARDFEGTGIGLAIVRRIVERHGGHAWAEGEAGKGATFYVSMPRGVD